MPDDIVIKVEHVSKDFVLPHEKISSVKGLFTGAIKRKTKKTRETQHALKDISFEVKKGEFFGIVGRNGSGKSTLLKILAQIYQPSRGKIITKGKLVPFIELGVGFNPELTGRENVYLNGAMLGFSRREIDNIYDDIVSFAELQRFMNQKLKNYSSGMQVRLAFSMAIRANAEILLVDEVLAVGDADFQRKCFDYFRNLKKNNKTVIFVSHDMNAVREYCDRALLIDNSEVVYQGRPDKVAGRYSRMFIDESNSGAEQRKPDRWGNNEVIFVDAKVIPDKLTSEIKSFKILLEIEAKINSRKPLIGFSLKDSTGHPLIGTNTRLQEIDTGTLAKGERLELTFDIPNILADGNYSVDIALEAESGAYINDWWEDALTIKAYQANPAPTIVSPPIEVHLNRLK